jgi:hypothetical protein
MRPPAGTEERMEERSLLAQKFREERRIDGGGAP